LLPEAKGKQDDHAANWLYSPPAKFKLPGSVTKYRHARNLSTSFTAFGFYESFSHNLSRDATILSLDSSPESGQ